MKTLLTAIVLILISCQVQAATTKDLVACTSERNLDEFFSLLGKNDKRGMMYMLESQKCIMTKPGIEISILDRSWTQSKIRAYTSYGAVDLWTVNENISE